MCANIVVFQQWMLLGLELRSLVIVLRLCLRLSGLRTRNSYFSMAFKAQLAIEKVVRTALLSTA